MDATELANKIFDDKGFLVEAFKHMPEDMVNKFSEEHAGEEGIICEMLGEYMMPYVEDEGLDISKEDIVSACEERYDKLNAFKIIGFGLYVAKSLSKAGFGK